MRTLLIVLSALVLAACSGGKKPPEAETPVPVPAPPARAAVTPVAPAEAPAAAPAAETPATKAASPAGSLTGAAGGQRRQPASPPMRPQQGPKVAEVLGTPIYADQIDINEQTRQALLQASGPAREEAEARIETLRQGRLSARVHRALIDREIVRLNLSPNDAESAAVLAWGRANLQRRIEISQAELQSSNLPPESRAKLEKQIGYNQRELDAAGIPDEQLDAAQRSRRIFALEVAKKSIERWRFQKIIHQQYGGPVNIARAGPPQPTAPQAMRAWLAECVRRGDLVFQDKALEEAFLAYQAADDPKQKPAPENYFDVPWWELPP